MGALKSLNQLRRLRKLVVGTRIALLRLRDVRIGPGSTVSMTARLRGPVRVGSHSYVAFKTRVEADGTAGGAIVVGDNCFIGGGSTLLPGTRIGDGCIVAAGAVVSGEVPSGTIVAGNPARVVRENIEAGQYGMLPVAAENSRKMYRP